VLIGKVLSYFVDVFFVGHSEEDISQVGILKVPPRYPTVIICVDLIEYPHDNGVSITFLKLRSSLQEFEAWVTFQQVLEKWFQVIGHDIFFTEGGQGEENPPFDVFPDTLMFFPEVDNMSLIHFGVCSWISFQIVIPIYLVKKHIFQNLRDCKNFHCNIFEVGRLQFSLGCETLCQGFIMFFYFLAGNWFPLRIIELRDVFL